MFLWMPLTHFTKWRRTTGRFKCVAKTSAVRITNLPGVATPIQAAYRDCLVLTQGKSAQAAEGAASWGRRGRQRAAVVDDVDSKSRIAEPSHFFSSCEFPLRKVAVLLYDRIR